MFLKKKLNRLIFFKLINIITAIKYSNKIRIPVILILIRNAVKNVIKIIYLKMTFLFS